MVQYSDLEIAMAFEGLRAARFAQSPDWPRSWQDAMRRPMVAALLRSEAQRAREAVKRARVVQQRPPQPARQAPALRVKSWKMLQAGDADD